MAEDQLTAVAAVARNGVIGYQGRMPWHLPADLKHFKQVTLGGALIMGRATYDSIGRALPGRATIVVSRRESPDFSQSIDGTTSLVWSASTTEALSLARQSGRAVFVVGGGGIYRAFWPDLTDLEITEVDQEPLGDTVFPAIGLDWVETGRQPYDGYAFVHYRRV